MKIGLLVVGICIAGGIAFDRCLAWIVRRLNRPMSKSNCCKDHERRTSTRLPGGGFTPSEPWPDEMYRAVSASGSVGDIGPAPVSRPEPPPKPPTPEEYNFGNWAGYTAAPTLQIVPIEEPATAARHADAIRFSDKMHKIQHWKPPGYSANQFPSLADKVRANTPEPAMCESLRKLTKDHIGHFEMHSGLNAAAAQIAELHYELELQKASMLQVFQDETEFEEQLKKALALADDDCHDGNGDCTEERILETLRSKNDSIVILENTIDTLKSELRELQAKCEH